MFFPAQSAMMACDRSAYYCFPRAALYLLMTRRNQPGPHLFGLYTINAGFFQSESELLLVLQGHFRKVLSHPAAGD